MKLIRFGTPGNEKPGLILDDGRHIVQVFQVDRAC
jgi:hypothetical protein